MEDIRPGSAGSNPDNLTAVGDRVYFSANDGVNGTELWRSNGNAANTQLVKDIRPGNSPYGTPNSSNPDDLTAVDGTLFFSANDGVTGVELWKSDGTDPGHRNSSWIFGRALAPTARRTAPDPTN